MIGTQTVFHLAILGKDFGMSRLDMKESIREVTNIQKLRETTNNSKQSEQSAERVEVLQHIVSKMFRFQRKSNTKVTVKMWITAKRLPIRRKTSRTK